MARDIKKWCKSCLQCQKSKITRHTVSQPANFVAPEARFRHVHIDIVGPLPESEGFRYLLTMIDRFSRWPEAVPIKDIEATTVCRAFVDNWVTRFGSPETLTTDQGSQFESRLFKALLQLTGCRQVRTTAYHPAANGMIERWHRSFKAAVMCHVTRRWTRSLSTVMLGLRSNVMDCGSSPAEYVYGTTLRIPGEFVLPEDFAPNPQIFLEEFREHMRAVKPVPVEHRHKRNIFVHKNLSDCSHVFLKIGPVRKSLEPPYSGPHRVVARPSSQVIDIDINGKTKTVSIENVKPAFFLKESTSNVQQAASSTTHVPANVSPPVALDSSGENSVQHVNRDGAVPSGDNPYDNSNVRPPLRTYSKKHVSFKV